MPAFSWRKSLYIVHRTNATLGVRSNAPRIFIHIVTTAMEADSLRITRLIYNSCGTLHRIANLNYVEATTIRSSIDPTCFSRLLPTKAPFAQTKAGLECCQPTAQLYTVHYPAFKILHATSHYQPYMQSSHEYDIEISRLGRFKQFAAVEPSVLIGAHGISPLHF